VHERTGEDRPVPTGPRAALTHARALC